MGVTELVEIAFARYWHDITDIAALVMTFIVTGTSFTVTSMIIGAAWLFSSCSKGTLSSVFTLADFNRWVFALTLPVPCLPAGFEESYTLTRSPFLWHL